MWYGMVAFLYTEGIQLTAAHSGGRCSDLTQEEVQPRTFCGMPGSFNSSHINACVVRKGVLGPRFIVSSEGLGLHKMLPPREFEPGTSRMPGKRCTTMLQLPQHTMFLLTSS